MRPSEIEGLESLVMELKVKEQHKETCMEPCMKSYICEQLPLTYLYLSSCSNCWLYELKVLVSN